MQWGRFMCRSNIVCVCGGGPHVSCFLHSIKLKLESFSFPVFQNHLLMSFTRFCYLSFHHKVSIGIKYLKGQKDNTTDRVLVLHATNFFDPWNPL